jgi:hypothetical protein
MANAITIVAPRDEFTGRSDTRFGVGEFIDLTAKPLNAKLGDVRWCTESDTSGGKVTQTHNDGGVYTALYTAGLKAGDVTLVCQAVSHPKSPKFEVYRKTFAVVEPDEAVMVQTPGTHIYHQHDVWSVGFIGDIYLQPTDVSFNNCTFQEGTCTGVGSGYLSKIQPKVHPIGLIVHVGDGNAETGCQVLSHDTAAFTQPHTPYGDGEWLWPIPWRFGVRVPSPGRPPTIDTVFTIAYEHATADASGRATIEKKDCGPFSRMPADPTSGFWYGPDPDWPWPPRTAKPERET